MADQLNIVFLHSHNTGTFIQPYGHPVPTPNLQRLAEEGVLFRRAFSCAPTCSPSRAGFLTGMYSHCTGLLGLSHRGFSIDTRYHLVQTLKQHGYFTALAGCEHVTADARTSGYDEVLDGVNERWPVDGRRQDAATQACAFLARRHEKPFFLSVGLFDTHTPFPDPDPGHHPGEDARWCHAFPGLPDTEVVRREVARYKASARRMDDDFGRVLKAIDRHNLRDKTLVFCFSDHGLQIPRNMCNLTDRGIHVYLLARGPGITAVGQTCDGLVSLIDLVPTALELAGLPLPPHVQGRSFAPLLAEPARPHRHEIYAELNFHASYEPQRCVRTERYKYIRRYDDRRRGLVMPNTDDSPIKDYLMAQGWQDQPRDAEALFDLVFDPSEACNLIDDPRVAGPRDQLRGLLDAWLAETDDPIRASGVIEQPPGTRVNDANGRSPSEPPISR